MGIKVKDTGLIADTLEQELKNLKIKKLVKEYIEQNPNLSDEEYENAKLEIERKVYSETE